MDEQLRTTNISVICCCAAAFIAYHVYLGNEIWKRPAETVAGVTAHSRSRWVATMVKAKVDVVPIQTVRTFIVSSKILATSAVALFFGFSKVLTTLLSQPTSSNSSFGLDGGWVPGKVLALEICLVISFFSFCQAMRFYGHVTMGLRIGLHEERVIEAEYRRLNKDMGVGTEASRRQEIDLLLTKRTRNIDCVVDMLDRGFAYHWLGLRGYYMMFPLYGYLWGPWMLLATTVILIALLRIVDFSLDSMTPEFLKLGIMAPEEDVNEEDTDVESDDESIIGADSHHIEEVDVDAVVPLAGGEQKSPPLPAVTSK
ncbi:hypothetical protein HDU98_001486 [Podochytrium sp. JEL0797]|nr:hypothetical protein HDU98_001486 [Podochytrium sp. JEL0797]